MLAEMKLKLAEEKSKLQQLEADSEVEVSKARVRAYNNFDASGDCDEATDKVSLDSLNTDFRPFSNLLATPFIPQHATLPKPTAEDAGVAQEAVLTQAMANSFALSRLPVPEPSIFTGDPLKFIDWKVSFKPLIDQKPLPASEKMLYLKSCLAVEGFFYCNSEDAYHGAWAV